MKYNFKNTTTSDVLNKITDLDIFKHYIPQFERPGKFFCASIQIRGPDNPDKHPSCQIYNHGSKWYYKDFGTSEVYSCWGYVMKLLKLDLQDSINHIFNNVNIGPISHVVWHKPSCTIDIEKRPYNEQDEVYWAQFGGTLELLRKYLIIPLKSYTVWCSSTGTKTECHNLTYSYEKGDNISRKIYAPFSLAKHLRTNTEGWVIGFSQLPAKGELLIITKSLKDVITWTSLGHTAISVQSEGQSLGHYTLYNLQKRFKQIIINYDNDKTGKDATDKIIKQYGFKAIFMPDNTAKDISEYYSKYGKEQCQKMTEGCLKPINGFSINML